jgi:hypothetical protein
VRLDGRREGRDRIYPVVLERLAHAIGQLVGGHRVPTILGALIGFAVSYADEQPAAERVGNRADRLRDLVALLAEARLVLDESVSFSESLTALSAKDRMNQPYAAA